VHHHTTCNRDVRLTATAPPLPLPVVDLGSSEGSTRGIELVAESSGGGSYRSSRLPVHINEAKIGKYVSYTDTSQHVALGVKMTHSCSRLSFDEPCSWSRERRNCCVNGGHPGLR
jgi:hypothetical protein